MSCYPESKEFEELVATLGRFEYNISVKGLISSWKQGMKHKVFRCPGNVKTLHLFFSIEDAKGEQVKSLLFGGKAP